MPLDPFLKNRHLFTNNVSVKTMKVDIEPSNVRKRKKLNGNDKILLTDWESL